MGMWNGGTNEQWQFGMGYGEVKTGLRHRRRHETCRLTMRRPSSPLRTYAIRRVDTLQGPPTDIALPTKALTAPSCHQSGTTLNRDGLASA